MRKIIFLLFFMSFLWNTIYATESEKKLTISGYIRDLANGEELIGSTILIKELKTGTATNVYGFYSISLPKGEYTLIYSFIGYQSIEKKVNLIEDITLDIELITDDKVLKEVLVTGERKHANIKKAEMSVVKMDRQTIKQIPALMGEVDVIKAIQLLPGVQVVSEGSSGFSVRGGSADQNLILLDEAIVYNASHLMGFFSVFNNDAIKDVKLYKGDIPASHGGRLASLLDIRMKNGNSKKVSGAGGIGTISSRLTLEAPVGDKITSMISGRRTYADLFLPFASDKSIRKNKLYFYDLNMKASYKYNDNNRFYISGYLGQDIFKNDDENSEMNFGNQTLTGRWNHLFSKKLFSNFSFIYSRFNYALEAENDGNPVSWVSDLHNQTLKLDFTYYLNPDNTIRFGVVGRRNKFEPCLAKGESEEGFFDEFKVPHAVGIESGYYISNEQTLGARLNVKYGLRLSVFQNYGNDTTYTYAPIPNDVRYQTIDSKKESGFYNTYAGLEPRLSMSFSLTEESSIKASYSRTRQYVQLASNSTGGMPLDIWFPASKNVKPQISDQVATGYFRNFFDGLLETSVEVYYKKMDNTIDFRDHAQLLFNKQLDGELRFGEATSYGIELYLKLVGEKLNGWISYTLSHTERTIKEINNGKAFVAPYNKPHDFAIVLTYNINKRISLSTNWIYSSGLPATLPIGRINIENQIIPIYSDRNEYRLPDYHRLDLALTIKGKDRPDKKWHGEWNFSIYNAYYNKNLWTLNFPEEENNPNERYAEMTYLFPILPSITYNFHF